MEPIQPISGIPQTIVHQQTVERVVKINDNQHRIEKTIYEVITYDKQGQLSKTTNSHTVDYVI